MPPAEKQRFIRGQIIINAAAAAPSAEEEEAEHKRQEAEELRATDWVNFNSGMATIHNNYVL